MHCRYCPPIITDKAGKRKRLCNIVVLLLFGFLIGAQLNAATVFTDKADYPPEDTVLITGTEFLASETVTVQVTHYDGNTPETPDYDPWNAVANAYGIFDTYWVVPEDALAETLVVTATGQSSGYIATTVFSDCNSILVLSSSMSDTLCPGSPMEFCVTLYQPCPGGGYAPLANRSILFFLNEGNCGVNVGQTPLATISTDGNGEACFYTNAPDTNGTFSLRAKYLGEPKPESWEPPNGACNPDTRINISAANFCQEFTVDASNSACDNNPPVATCPGDTSVFLCSPGEVCIPGFGATDPDNNIESITVSLGTLSSGTVCFTPAGAGAYTITLIATDSTGLADTCETVVTVSLNNAPVCIIPSSGSYFVCGDTTFSFPVSATDADGNLTGCSMTSGPGTLSEGNWTFTTTGPGVYSASFTCTDACGATCSGSVDITVSYNSAPVCNLPSDGSYFVCGDTTFSFPVSATDAEGNLVGCSKTSGPGTLSGGNWTFTTTGPGVYSASFACTDACGASCSGTVNITVDYNAAPVITCPANLTISCEASTDPSNTGNPTVTDDNDPSPVVTYSDSETAGGCPQEKTITRTWTATDNCGAVSQCQQIITVEDNTAPVITCPANLTIECDESSDPTNTGYATATDNCDAAPVVTYSDYANSGTITRTWTATDACGNSSQCTQTITIDDTTQPVITCPANVTIACDESTDPSNTGSATATDNCDTNPVITYTDTETAGSCPQEKTITRTWKATDNAGNFAACQQIITVEDNVAPVITCPANLTIECDESSDPSNTGYATATDNCDAAPVVTYSDVANSGTITRTWTATDACGNSSQCTQTITIDDTTQPVITCPANVTIACDESTDPSNTGSATATDNCDANPVITYTDNETAGSCPQEKTITRTWKATDNAGNFATCQQIITVEDNVAPVITCPANLTIECDESSDPSNTGYATAADNCDASPVVTYSDVANSGTITRTWTATDACGNSSQCTQTITIDDTTQPVITCPANVTIACDESTDPSNTGSATATDNCDTNPVITYTDNETAGSCPQEKTITRTWKATDNAGNFATCQQTITVEDNVAPVITCPANLTIECDESSDPSNTGYATATDNCDASPVVTYSDVANSGTITRTWTATDACGNSSQCTQTITIDDTTQPVITCPANVTIACDESTDPSNTGSATATDNCDTNPVITYTDNETAGSCPQEKTITRTWKATDNAGNFATCQQIITVEDNTAPVITCPANLTIECDESSDPTNTGYATATDNCDAAPVVTYSDVANSGTITRTWIATDACGNSSQCTQTITIDDTTQPVISCPANVTIACDESTDPSNTGSATATDNCDANPAITYTDGETAGSCPQEKTITRTWKATDNAGNFATCQQIITVEDNVAPVITCPANVTIECDASIDPSNTGYATAVDNCDASPQITYTDNSSGDTLTRTWTATDACGNSSQCTQTITIDDTTQPVISCPANVTIACDESTDPSNTGSATATDNCDTNPVITYTDGETAGSCPQEKTITRTWKATDDAGNFATCQQIISVEDNTAPVIACPANLTIECDESSDPSNTGYATAADNCDASPVVTYSDVANSGTITRTWTATDACGNSSQCTQTITIDDTTQPVISCPANVTIACDESTDPSNTGSATATDNCDANPAITYTDGETAGSCPQEKTITRTWKATDNAGNFATCQQIITVEDNVAPVITCPANVTIECDASIDPSNTGYATAVDNCDASPQITYTDNSLGDTLTRTWTATDACGNSTSCQQLIIFEDTTPPTLVSCPPDLTIQCDQSLAPSITGSAEAGDNCDPSPVVTFSDSETPGSCPQEKTITRSWIATDADGNSATICQQTITVVDTTPPAITCPASLAVECGQPTDPDHTGYATAVDNCDPSPVITYSDTRSNGTTTRTWTATDACGNSAQCTQTITVDDTTPPTVSCPPNLTISCEESTDPSNTGPASSSDDCDSNPALTYSDSETPGGCAQEKTITRTWTATDASGNWSNCQQTITVIDTTAPVITCPADITIECDASTDPSVTGSASVVDNGDPAPVLTYSDVDNGDYITRTWTATDDCGNSSSCQQIITREDTTPPVLTCPSDITVECDQPTVPSNTGSATAVDNCDPNPAVSYTDSETPGGCPNEKTITRTWVATDSENNSSQCVQTITVVDGTEPVITCPPNVTIECDESSDPSATGYATATDNCDANPGVTYTDNVNGNTLTRTWTANDACGNSSQCQQIITINDTTDPIITCPANITIACDESSDPSNTGSATATDNCDTDQTITYTDNETAGSCPQEKTITRTWKATDNAGNFAECQQIITIEDNVAPQITCPPTYVIECNESNDPSVTGSPTVSDNCDPSPIVSYTDSLAGTTIVRKWTAADHCGNSVECMQLITPAPNDPPVVTCPGDTTIFLCTLTDTALAGFYYSDPDDNLASVNLEGGTLDGNIARFTPVAGANVLTLIAQDECGEVDTCKTIVTVILNNPPDAGDDYSDAVFQCNNNQICLDGFSCSDVDGNLANCYAAGGVLTNGTVCFTPVNGINTIKIIAVDACGAADTALITVDVTINSAPAATCPGFTTQNEFELPAEVCVSGFECHDADGNLTTCTAAVTDHNGALAGTFDGSTVCFTADAMGMYSVTLTATDECGAVSTCVTDVFVKKVSNCPIVRIEKTHNTYQGYYENVSITVENSSYDFEAFDFLIAYDASALNPVEVVEGQWLANCEWEYFTYRFGVNGNCGTGCPSGLLRIVAIAEMNDGAHHPTCYGPPDRSEYELAIMRFLVTNDRTFECQYVPITFFWSDCGDNSISGMDGEIMYIDNIIYDFAGNVVWDEEYDAEYPESERIPYIGAPDLCLNPDPNKPSAVRCIEFVFGGVDIVCSDSIDAPGDINLNGVANEIADAVVFTNYFVYGLQAFNVNVEGQKAATDVNKDGVILTVSDLVYLVRIICGDALPIPKVAPHVEAQFRMVDGVLNADQMLGAAHIVIKGDAAVEIGKDASHMEMASHFDGEYTNVLIYSLTPDYSFGGDILITDGEIVSIDAADYDGNACAVKLVPNSFSLTGYPNPFNPVTNIEMNLPTATDWTIGIYNVTGRKVTEFSGRNESGLVKIQWDASDQASGVYFFKAEAGKYSASRKMLLLK